MIVGELFGPMSALETKCNLFIEHCDWITEAMHTVNNVNNYLTHTSKELEATERKMAVPGVLKDFSVGVISTTL